MSLRFFADHCVPRSVVDSLRLAAHDVLKLGEVMPVDSDDGDLIQKAQELNAILLTLNGDFCDIVRYPPSQYQGIMALQARNHPELFPVLTERVSRYAEANPTMHHYRGKLFVVEVHRIRVRE